MKNLALEEIIQKLEEDLMHLKCIPSTNPVLLID